MLRVVAIISLLIPSVAVTETLNFTGTTCQHLIYSTLHFVTPFADSEPFRTHVNHYTVMGSISVKNDDLFWKCRIS